MRPCDRPFIMLMGLPRSGTTWFGKIFDSHPATVYRHEPDTVIGNDEIVVRPLDEMDGVYREQVRSYVDRVFSVRKARVSMKAPWFPKRYYSTLGWWCRIPLLHGFRAWTRFFGESDVPDLFRESDVREAPFVWKSILSTRIMGTVAAVMPQSRSVAIVRHPCGYVASIVRGTAKAHFSSAIPESEDYGIFEKTLSSVPAQERGLTLEHLRSLTPHERLAWRWIAGNDTLIREVRELSNVKTVRYEDLCFRPMEIARAMFEFVGLDWSDRTGDFVERSTSREHSSFYSVFKNPERSATKWRDELAPEDVERILAIVRGTLPGQLYEETMPLDAK